VKTAKAQVTNHVSVKTSEAVVAKTSDQQPQQLTRFRKLQVPNVNAK